MTETHQQHSSLRHPTATQPSITRSLAFAGISALAVGLSVLGGCNYLGPAIAIASGPDKTKAKFELDKERPTVLLIDDRGNHFPSRGLRDLVADQAQKDLLENKALKNVIDARGAAAALTQERPKELMDIASVGKSVKAEIVIYATVDEAALSQDGQSLSPKAVLRIKVIDVNKKPARVWPADSEGYKLIVQPVITSNASYTSAAAAQTAVFEIFAKQIGTELAELFYEHVTKKSISDIRPN